MNRVPTNATTKTPYELWAGRKSSLKHLHIGDVQLKRDGMSLKKENWTSEQLVAIMLDIQKNRGVSSFTILALEVSLKLEMHISLRILNLMGEIKS